MNPLFVLFGIRAALRLGRTGAEIYAQRSRDRAVFLPDLIKPDVDRYALIVTFYSSTTREQALLANEGLAPLWDEALHRPIRKSAAVVDTLFAAVVEARIHEAEPEDDAETELSIEIAGGFMIEQWNRSTAPISPVGRIALTMADIALEFVGSNPSVMGIGGNGERLIGAIALNLSQMIPDDQDEFGTRAKFADRLVGIFLRAGLSVLADHPELVVDQDHLQDLMAETLTPLVTTLPDDLSEQLEWRALLDALAGPAASAAFGVVAERPDAFLGKAFSTDKAVGAVTQALFGTVSDMGLRTQLTDAGWLKLYKSVLRVAADRPGLFIGGGGQPKSELLRDLLSGVAATLHTAEAFDGKLGGELAAVAIDALNENAAVLLKLDDQDEWQVLAIDMIGQVSGALSDRLRHPDQAGALRLFGKHQLLELSRIFLVQAAATPGMLGIGRTELRAIVSGVATAMAADKNLLLTSDDWLKIAAVAAAEASANPGRLFGLDESTAEGALGAEIIGGLLTVAAAEWDTLGIGDATGRDAGHVLAGPTLRDAITVALRAAAGNARAAASAGKPIETLAARISNIVRDDPEAYGSDEWLLLFREMIGSALIEGTVVDISDGEIRAILSKRDAA
ncbi:MAG: hypothetical protein ACE363_09355 [Alphaproteobacteria bacterium]